MAFWAIKTNFPGPPAWLWPGPAPGGEGGVQLPQTLPAFNAPFFSQITIEKLIQTLKYYQDFYLLGSGDWQIAPYLISGT